MKKIKVILKTLKDFLIMSELSDRIENKFFSDLVKKTFQAIRNSLELTHLCHSYKKKTLNRMISSHKSLIIGIKKEALKLSHLSNLKNQIFKASHKELNKIKPKAISLLDSRINQHLSVTKTLLSLNSVQNFKKQVHEKEEDVSQIKLEKKYLEILKDSNNWDFLR